MQNITTETKSNLLVCKCGSGQGLNNTVSTYRPGHDAKHVSVLVSYLFTNKDALSSGEDFFAQSFLYHRKQLPSIALQNKFTRAVFNLLEKDAKLKTPKINLDKQEIDNALHAKTTAYCLVDREIEQDGGRHKIGRWDYPTGSIPGDDKVYYNNKRDGSGEWVLLEGTD